MCYLFTRKCYYTLVFLCLGVALPVWAESPLTPPLTLKEAIEKTLTQNLQLHQFKFIQQRLVANRETDALRPAYNVDMELENVAGSGEATGFDRAEITVALSSVIELGDKRQSRLSVADARLDQFQLTRQAETLDVLGNLTTAFILSLAIQEKLTLAAEGVALSQALLNTVSQRAQRGAASDAEVLRAKAMLTQSEIQQANLQQQFERQKIALASYWGETTVGFSLLDGDLFTFEVRPVKALNLATQSIIH